MDDMAHGLQATVIDLGLSRMDAGDEDDGDRVYWTPFDDEVFMGEGKSYTKYVNEHVNEILTATHLTGDYQFDVYRMTKVLTGGSWSGYHPVTNVLVRL